jgi:CCDC81-like HU domain protein/sporulation related protein
MNLADYLSELLGQHDEISVPGLGYFVRTRINAYYNEKEAKFYPPFHQVKFVPQPKEDDTFVQYVADKKNISLASSKYFAEKFISKLKEEAAKGKYLFADLGLFYTDQGQLVFKPNDRVAADPAFYGYPQINIYKLGQPLYPENPKPVFASNLSGSPVTTAPVPVVQQPQYFEEEAEHKRPVNVWLIILIALTVIALAVFGVYKFYPEAFDKAKAAYNKILGKQDSVVSVYRHDNAIASKGTGKDSTTKTTIPAADTTKKAKFEIIVSDSRTVAMANANVDHLRSLGLKATVSIDEPGRLYKVSVGTYPTSAEADAAMQGFIKAGKISKDSKVLPINPQQ